MKDLIELLDRLRNSQALDDSELGATAGRAIADVSFGGFFAHIIYGDRGAACGLSHGRFAPSPRYALLLPDVGTVSPVRGGPLRVRKCGQGLMPLAGWDVSLELLGQSNSELERRQTPFRDCRPPRGEASPGWHALDLVPDFSDLCEGATLRGDWDTAKNIISIVRYPGGELFSDPIYPLTFEKAWTWTLSNGDTCCQPITDILRYRSREADAIELRITSRQSGRRFSYPLRARPGSPIRIYFLGFVRPTTDEEVDETLIDVAHLWATLQLCDTSSPINWHLPAARPLATLAAESLAFESSGLDHHFRQGYLRFGKPNCGGRLLYER